MSCQYTPAPSRCFTTPQKLNFASSGLFRRSAEGQAKTRRGRVTSRLHGLPGRCAKALLPRLAHGRRNGDQSGNVPKTMFGPHWGPSSAGILLGRWLGAAWGKRPRETRLRQHTRAKFKQHPHCPNSWKRICQRNPPTEP